ncbi:unnamed protein product [Somion occarium]|uniref:Uncharacterized protein n=1 Tax=Somion occarium TaxID=3059160 RepID=A0ABP1DJE9_9APHY
MAEDPFTCTSLPNPLAPAAWLSPNLAPQYEVAKSLLAATLGAWIWDVLTAVSDDVRMLRKSMITLPNAVYVLSRILTGAVVVAALLFESRSDSPIMSRDLWDSHLDRGMRHALQCPALLLPSEGRLFALALDTYRFSHPLALNFLLLGESFGFQSDHIGPTRYCIVSNVTKFSSIGFISVAIFDTSVFVAISIHMISFSMETTWRGRLKLFLSGHGMGHVSRALLQTGQMYYLVTVWVNVVVLITLLMSLISPTFQGMLTIPNIALQNAMACRVFRLLKLGLIREDASIVTPSMGSLAFRSTRRPHATFATTQESTLGAIGEETEDIALAVLRTKQDSESNTSPQDSTPNTIVQELETTVDAEDRKKSC